MEIKVNGLEVISNGSLVVSKEHPISFRIGGMNFIFDFINDDSGEYNVKQERDGNTMLTHLVNFNNALGTGMKEPTEMATLTTGEKIYFSFAVHSISENPRIFHYTWLLGPKPEESQSHE